MKWQSIDTAPQGVMILLCSMKTIETTQWAFVDWIADKKMILHPKWDATHWMPLPKPPEEGEK